MSKRGIAGEVEYGQNGITLHTRRKCNNTELEIIIIKTVMQTDKHTYTSQCSGSLCLVFVVQ